MANLSETALASRKLFKILVLLVVVAVVGLVLFMFGKRLFASLFPPPPTPATVAFGKLPPLDVSEGFKPTAQMTYSLETITGDLPTFSPYAKVFTYGKNDSSFGDIEKAREVASSLRFKTEPVEVSPGVYKFEDTDGETKITLSIVAANNNFEYSTDYLNNPQVVESRPENDESAVNIARNFFENMGVDVSNSNYQTKYFEIANGQLRAAVSLSAANVVEVNFSVEDLDKVKVISAKEGESSVWALVSHDSVVHAKNSLAKLQRGKFSDYPLKGSQQAFEDLKAGEGALNRGFTKDVFPIRTVDLGYLQTVKNNGFLQPVYIFNSDDGLAAYVAAVDYSWITE